MIGERNGDLCQDHNCQQELVEMIRKKQLSSREIFRLAELFKTMGDPTRLRIISSLQKEELCVCELSELLELSPSAISHQLRVLRSMHLVRYRKEGRSVYYSLDDDHVLALFVQALEHVREERD